MSANITRRALITGGIKAGAGFAIVYQMPGMVRPVFAFSTKARDAFADRLQPAYKGLDEYVARHISEVGAPGMTLALADRNGLLRSSQYGFADMKAGIKVAPETLFEIGSISKSFVAMAVLQLAEEGKLDLQKPVINYLPWLKIESKYSPFTTHHLLSHTSGLSGLPLLMRVAATTLRVGFEPGSRWVYSNIGYVLLARHCGGQVRYLNLVFVIKQTQRSTDYVQSFGTTAVTAIIFSNHQRLSANRGIKSSNRAGGLHCHRRGKRDRCRHC